MPFTSLKLKGPAGHPLLPLIICQLSYIHAVRTHECR